MSQSYTNSDGPIVYYTNDKQGGQKKFMMWSTGKVFEKFQNIFWWSLSLYVFRSSQEVRAF